MNAEIHHTIESVPKGQWNHVVEQSPHGSALHRYEWLAAVERGRGETPRHVLVESDDTPVAVFPNFVESVPLTPFDRLSSPTPGFGGPIIATEEDDALDALLEAVEHACDEGIIAHAFRTLDEGTVRYERRLEDRGYRQKIESCRFVVDLADGWESIHSAMSSSRRRAIRSGHDADFDVRDEVPDRGRLEAFHEGYQRVMERVDGDAYPWSFFSELLSMDDRIRLFSLEVEGEHAGSLLFLVDEEQSTLHYFFSAVERAHFDHNASELLHEHAMKWGIDREYRYYDFGETSPDFSDGLFRFKERFGGRVVPTLSWERGCAPVRWNAFRVGRRLYQSANRLRAERA